MGDETGKAELASTFVFRLAQIRISSFVFLQSHVFSCFVHFGVSFELLVGGRRREGVRDA